MDNLKVWWKKLRPATKILVSSILAILFFTVAVPILLWICLHDLSKQAQFGDMFGAASAVFTGLALVGAIYAILLQSEELELQREELIKSNSQFEAQNRIMQAQFDAAQAAQRASEAKARFASRPFFRVTNNQDPSFMGNVVVHIWNAGAAVYDCQISFNHEIQIVPNDDLWKTDEEKYFKRPRTDFDNPILISISFFTQLSDEEETIRYKRENGRWIKLKLYELFNISGSV